MVHHTCDQCGRVIDGERYSVQIEMRRVSSEDFLSEEDLDRDNLQAIADEISLMDSTSEFQLPVPSLRTITLDLCPACQRRFEKDPLARETRKRFNISPN